MSRRTTQFKKKIGQQRRTGGVSLPEILPMSTVKSDGHTTIYGQVDSLDDEGNPQKAGKRYPGRATGKTVTEPMKAEKVAIYEKLAK